MKHPETSLSWRPYLAVAALGAFLVLTPVAERLEWAVMDGQFRAISAFRMREAAPMTAPAAAPAAAPAVLVVGIDDESLARFQVPVAALHRQIGAFFEAMAAAGPRGVVVDMVLPEGSFDHVQPGLDMALARGIVALRARAPLVLGVGARQDGSPRPLHPLFANLAGADGMASVFVPRDADGVVRRFDERIGAGGEKVSTLAGQMARRLGVAAESGLIPFGTAPRLPYLPLHQVISPAGRMDPEALSAAFAGKVVVLGSLLSHDDQQIVPVPLAAGAAGMSTHGVFVHAQQLQALLSGTLIRPLAPWAALALALLFAASWFCPPRPRWAAAVLAAWGGLMLAATIAQTRGVMLPAAALSIALLGGFLARAGFAAVAAAAERRRLRRAFDGFVSPPVLREILAGRLHPSLGGERRDLCVLFSDIRSFTTLSETLPPEALTDILNRYFERMAAVIHRHGGTLDKFIGDGIMAFFGAPRPDPAMGDQAVAAAREMLDALAGFNAEQRAAGGPTLAIGIGLHVGPAFVGYVGATHRHEYSAIGDTVNVAARLEGLTKEVGRPIVISAELRARLADPSGFECMGSRAIKGRSAMEVYGWTAQA